MKMISRRAARGVIAVLVFAAAAPLGAREPYQPSAILEVMRQSKLRYEIGSPVQRPVAELQCPSRGSNMRVVRAAGQTELVPWQPSAAAAPHFAEAEKLYAQRRLAAAGKEYEEGLALDPGYGPGWLYAGDIPFHQKNYPAALAAYRKALALDPTIAQAHRFAADALARMGRFSAAEDELVSALAYDPAYEGAFTALADLGHYAGFTVQRPQFQPPPGAIGDVVDGKVAVAAADAEIEWLSYLMCKAVWRHEDAYRAKRLGGRGSPYSWSIDEERECLASYVSGNLSLSEMRLKEEAAKSGHPEATISQEQILAAAPGLARYLVKVAEAGLVDGYVLFAVSGSRCPLTVVMLPDEMHAEIERFIRKFVVLRPVAPAAPGKPSPASPPAQRRTSAGLGG